MIQEYQKWRSEKRYDLCTAYIRAIARELGMSRNTVRKLLKEKEEPHYHRTFYRSVIDGYKETIYEWVEKYGFNGTRIYRELKGRGYTESQALYTAC